MISQRKIEANRRNAQKSTGPTTEEGKQNVRLNALKHGLCAQTIVLPHEDAQAYQERLEAWTADIRPRTTMEAYLVDRAVRISWQLDRADFHEQHRLTRRVREHRGDRAGEPSVEMLLEKLLFVPGDAELLGTPRENPAELINQLEATAEGCRALLDQWTGLWSFLAREQDNQTSPSLPDERLVGYSRMVRLLGYAQVEADFLAIMDDRIRALHQIQQLIDEDAARAFGNSRTRRGGTTRNSWHSSMRISGRWWTNATSG